LSLKARFNGPLGVPDPRKHVAQFRRHCYHLIAVGYVGIHDEDHSQSDEDFITQRLKESIQAAQREGTLPRWADRYFVTDQAPVTVPGRASRARPKIDIEIQSHESRNHPVYHFEAKRLRLPDSHSVSEYLGPSGLGCFLTELYGRSGDEGGMLGYVQSDTPTHWADLIQSRVRDDPEGKHRVTKLGTWRSTRLVTMLKYTYTTQHNRPNLGNITICHTLLDFRNEPAQPDQSK